MWTLVGERHNLPADRRLARLGDRRWAAETLAAASAFSDPRSRARLALLGLDRDRCRAVNLLPPAPQDVPWDAGRARRVADLLRPLLAAGGPVLLAGGRVAAAFGVCRPGNPLAELYGEPVDAGGLRAVLLPHPSGLCRWWNDRRRVAALARKLGAAGGGQPRSPFVNGPGLLRSGRLHS